MPFNIQTALQIGQFAAAAYNFNPAANSYPLPFSYQLVNVIYGNDLATDIGGPKGVVPFGFVARAPAPALDFVVAIRGTEGIWEWMQDARFLRVKCPFAAGAGETEDGFTDVYESLSVDSATGPTLIAALKLIQAANPAASLTINGHSLGAALATLLALDVAENAAFVEPLVITFASPMVGDAQFARTYNAEVPNSWRIANSVDLVPKLPPSFWGFDHVDQLASVNSFGKAKLLPSCTHALTTYLYLLDQQGGGTTFKLDSNCAGTF